MQDESKTDRLACATLVGSKSVNKAVDLLVEAGFSTESILVLLAEPDADEEDEVPVRLRTGVRRVLPITAALGAAGGLALVLFDGNASASLAPQLVTGLATGGFLGAMAGIVMGLGHWEHFVDLPDEEETGPMLVGVDLAAQGREAEARAALLKAGAQTVEICSRSAARQLLQSASAEPADVK